MELDYGESEAIVLSLERKADVLLIDERKGRIAANRFDIKYVGVLGILIESKHEDLIPKLDPIINDLISKAGFWMSRNLIQRVLEAGGELYTKLNMFDEQRGGGKLLLLPIQKSIPICALQRRRK